MHSAISAAMSLCKYAVCVCRPQRKQLHAALHTLALICIIGAIAAAISSHELKQPDRIPNFYSPHSWLGLSTLTVIVAQVSVFSSSLPDFVQSSAHNLPLTHGLPACMRASFSICASISYISLFVMPSQVTTQMLCNAVPSGAVRLPVSKDRHPQQARFGTPASLCGASSLHCRPCNHGSKSPVIAAFPVM